jgi:hypothetical protein
MTPRALAVCVLLAATPVGCASVAAERDGTSGATPSATAPGVRDVVVSEDDPSLPRGCRPAEIAGLLGELFDALNRGHVDAARALVIDPQMLPLLERPAAGRPLRLRAVIVGLGNGLGQIEFRAAGGLVGKGAVDCEARRFVAVGLGVERARMAPLCGRRARGQGAPLACVRHWS